MTKNFTLEEFTYSRTAIEHAINNQPGDREKENLKKLAVCLLQPLRDKLNDPIVILSGFRTKDVNYLVGGVPGSQHCKGEAADCYCEKGPEHLLATLKKSGLYFDQAIVYRHKKFLHLSYREGFNRRQVLYR